MISSNREEIKYLLFFFDNSLNKCDLNDKKILFLQLEYIDNDTK